jgi:uncharacterized protein (TIGR03437 family)
MMAKIIALIAWVPVMAQTSTNINLTLAYGDPSGFSIVDQLLLEQAGSAGSLGPATLVITSSSGPNPNAGPGPTQVTLELAFNEVDTIAISFTESDPNFAAPATVTMSGGTITGGTGAYTGATGSLDLTIVKDSAGAYWSTSTTNGSGTVTVGNTTIPLTLSNFRGWCCGGGGLGEAVYFTQMTVTGSLGNATGAYKDYYYTLPPLQVIGNVVVTFNSTDSLTLGFSWTPSTDLSPPPSFSGNIGGGTGKYANATGALNWTYDGNSLHVSGTMTTYPGASITQVKTVYGLPQIAFNTWLEIHGHNLVPSDTPSTGVDWSNAPDFASGQMPTQLGPISVRFGGVSSTALGYIYWYCSAQTNPNCADDQINVLAPTSLGLANPGPMALSVLNNGVPVATTDVLRRPLSPAFFSFDAAGHVAARHLDASLVGPADLYPGLSTPAKAGEIISLYGTGFGNPVGGGLVAGSVTQSGDLLTAALSCWVAELRAQAVGALASPGLYQINLTIPQGVPSGDNPVFCIYDGPIRYPTFPGTLIAVQ